MIDAIGLAIVIAAALIFALVGLLYTKGKKFTIEDYTTARRSVNLWTAVASLIAAAMGAWILFSPAEAAVTNGITALIGYAIGSASAVFIFAWIGARIRSLMPEGHTITEYVFHRYGKWMYALVLLIAVFYMSIFLTAELTGIGACSSPRGLIFTFTFMVGRRARKSKNMGKHSMRRSGRNTPNITNTSNH